jgi:hypothetical protein
MRDFIANLAALHLAVLDNRPTYYSFQYEIDMGPQAEYFSIDFYGSDICSLVAKSAPLW